MEEKKRFVLGKVTVADNNDYISYSNSDYFVTMDAIREKLINTHSGYLLIRYKGDVKYLDYLADFSDRFLQTVEFGKNLTDVKITCDHTERWQVSFHLHYCTVARPTIEGKTNEDSKEVQTETLELTATPLPNGLVKVKAGVNTSDAF